MKFVTMVIGLILIICTNAFADINFDFNNIYQLSETILSNYISARTEHKDNVKGDYKTSVYKYNNSIVVIVNQDISKEIYKGQKIADTLTYYYSIDNKLLDNKKFISSYTERKQIFDVLYMCYLKNEYGGKVNDYNCVAENGSTGRIIKNNLDMHSVNRGVFLSSKGLAKYNLNDAYLSMSHSITVLK